MKTKIQLRAAKITGLIGYIAVHYWFAIIKDNQIDRWEVWATPSRSQESWGHLHKNLMSYENGVGNGKSWVESEWNGKFALNLAEIIEHTPQIYPYNHYYRYYPGPNSNTYVQWVLNQTKSNYFLSEKGIGKNYKQTTFFNKILYNLSSFTKNLNSQEN